MQGDAVERMQDLSFLGMLSPTSGIWQITSFSFFAIDDI